MHLKGIIDKKTLNFRHYLTSGFFLDSNGFILTNNHVVKSSTLGKITVELSNGKKYPAKLIGKDNSPFI